MSHGHMCRRHRAQAAHTNVEGTYMRRITQRIATITTTLALALGTLAGCGGGAAVQPDPTTAEELLARYEALEDKENYHSDGTIDVSISLLGMDMPMKGTIKMDVDGDNSHSVMDLTTTILGEETQTTTESYTARDGANYVVYNSSEGEDGSVTWTKSTATEDTGSLDDSLFSDESLKGAEFAATENGYTLTQDKANINELMKSLNMDLDSLVGDLGDDWKADTSDDTSVVYTFDKDCRPTNVALKLGFALSYAGDDAGDVDPSLLSMGFDIAMNMDYSAFGQTDPDTVAVPDDVLENATEVETDDFEIEVDETKSDETKSDETSEADAA